MLVNGTLHIDTLNSDTTTMEALLKCDIGEFVIRDERLKHYTKGNYRGMFEIDRIEQSHNLFNGRMFFEIVAAIKAFAFLAEATPVLQETVPIATPTPTTVTKEPVVNVQTSFDEEINDQNLFGTLWPLADQVQLDTSCNRDLLRKQIDRLKQLGFTFDNKTQIWTKLN